VNLPAARMGGQWASFLDAHEREVKQHNNYIINVESNINFTTTVLPLSHDQTVI